MTNSKNNSETISTQNDRDSEASFVSEFNFDFCAELTKALNSLSEKPPGTKEHKTSCFHKHTL